MKRRSVDIFIVITLTVIAITSIYIVAPGWIVVHLLALLLVLVLPGYTLMVAVFREHLPGLPERVVLSLGLSIILVLLSGLLLNQTPSGLHASSWVVILSAITLASSAVVLIQRQKWKIPASIGRLEWKRWSFTFRQGLLLVMAAIVVCGAITVSIIGATQQPFTGFTQFWLLPAGGASPKNAVRLGVSNKEPITMEYRLVVNMNDKTIKVWPSLDLKSNEQWEAVLVLPQTGYTGSTKVEAMLYHNTAPSVIYRHVIWWRET